MTRRHAFAGLAGAVLAVAGLFLGGGLARADVEVDGAAPVSSTTTLPVTPLIAENESLIANTVFVPLDVRVVTNAVAFDYSLTSLGGSEPTAVPERFVLVASDGTEYTGSVSTPAARQVRFEGAADAVVVEIAVTQWRLHMWEEYDTSFSLTEPTTLTDGTQLVVERVLDETVGALVYFDVTTGRNRGFHGQDFHGPVLITSGVGWQDVLDVGRVGTSTGSPSLSVTVDPLPDPVPVHIVARPWVPMEERIVVFTAGGSP